MTTQPRWVHVLLEKGRDKENADFTKCVAADIDNMRNLLRNNIHEPDLDIVSGWPEHRREKPPSASGILKKIEDCPVGNKDVLLFYVSAHGETNENGRFINLQNPIRNEDDLLDRRALVEALKKKKARLTILITDCCATYKAGANAAKRKDAVYPKSSPRLPRGTAVFRPNITLPAFRKLFFESRGFVDISSCSQGQKSFTDSVEIGSVFTLAFCDTLEENRESARNATWKEIGSRIRNATEKRFEANFQNDGDYPRWADEKGETIVQKRQTPVFVISPR